MLNKHDRKTAVQEERAKEKATGEQARGAPVPHEKCRRAEPENKRLLEREDFTRASCPQ